MAKSAATLQSRGGGEEDPEHAAMRAAGLPTQLAAGFAHTSDECVLTGLVYSRLLMKMYRYYVLADSRSKDTSS